MLTRARKFVRQWTSSEEDGLFCVLCGAALFASERSLQVQCRHCNQYIHVRNMRITATHGAPRTVTCGDIEVEPRARVMGDLVARNVLVAGHVKGNILSTGEVRLTPTARISGHILCATLRVEPGAVLEGTIERVAN